MDKVVDETFHDTTRNPSNRQNASNETMETSSVSDEILGLDKDVIDLYSHVLLLMSTELKPQDDQSNMNIINHKLASLIEKMTPEFKEMIKTSSLEDVISILNATKFTENA